MPGADIRWKKINTRIHKHSWRVSVETVFFLLGESVAKWIRVKLQTIKEYKGSRTKKI